VTDRTEAIDDLQSVVTSLFEAGAATVKARITRGGTWEIEASREVATPLQRPPLRVK
jgi:hypothetical protein